MFAASPAAEKVRRSTRNLFRHFIVLAGGLLLVATAGTATAQAGKTVMMEDDDPFDRPGFYVGLSGVYQRNVLEGPIEDAIDDEIEDFGIGGGNTVNVSNFRLDIEDSGGLNAMVGYRAASFFAAELEYEWVDEYDVEVAGTGTVVSGPLTGQSIDVSGKAYSIEGHTLTLNTKWIVPFWRIQPYLLVGAGLSVYDTDRGEQADTIELITDDEIEIDGGTHEALAGRFGVGIDWYITKNVLINTNYNVVVTTRNFETPSGGNVDDLNYMGFSAGMQYRF